MPGRAPRPCASALRLRRPHICRRSNTLAAREQSQLVTAALPPTVSNCLVSMQVSVAADPVAAGRMTVMDAATDVDVGLGARLPVPGIAGNFTLDVARGLRDGRTAVSFVYEP